MTFKPAHKDNTAGQIRNEITLGDYIANKSRHDAFNEVKRKLTFDEWYALNEINTHSRTEHECMKMAWNAAQENK